MTVKLPVVGGVSKKALMIGGIASAAVVGLFLLRKRNAAAAAPADATGADATGGTGTGDYVDPGLQDTSQGPVYGATGYQDPNTGQWVYGNSGTGQAAATTNAQWAQNAIAYLGQNSGSDVGALGAALGAYLAGQPVTAAQVSLIDQAIAVEGYPPSSGPSGYPPGIHEGGTPSQGGTGGSGGGVTGSGPRSGPVTVIPVGLHATHIYADSAQVGWTAPRVPAGQGPLTGYGVTAYDKAGHVVNGPFEVPAAQLHANIGGLHRKTAYTVHVWCSPAKTGGPHASTSFTTK